MCDDTQLRTLEYLEKVKPNLFYCPAVDKFFLKDITTESWISYPSVCIKRLLLSYGFSPKGDRITLSPVRQEMLNIKLNQCVSYFNELPNHPLSDTKFKITRRHLKEWYLPCFNGNMWLNKPWGWLPFYLKENR